MPSGPAAVTDPAQKAFRKRLTIAMLIEAVLFVLGLLLMVGTGNPKLIIATTVIGAIPVVIVALTKPRPPRREPTSR